MTYGSIYYAGLSKMYKRVRIYKDRVTGEVFFQALYPATKGMKANGKMFKSEREAAISVDMFLINKGLAPLNILVKK